MKSIYEHQCDAALNKKHIALYWVEHYEAMPSLTEDQRVTLNVYRREADVCQMEYQRVKSRLTRLVHSERSRAERKAVAK